MAFPLKSLLQQSMVDDQLITVEVTVATGLEKIAVTECHEMFGEDTPIHMDRGRVYFNIRRNFIRNVFLMRSIDNVYLTVHANYYCFKQQKEDLSILLESYSEIEWKKPVSVWQEVHQYSGIVYPTKEEYEANKCIHNTLKDCISRNCKIENENKGSNIEVGDQSDKCVEIIMDRPDDKPHENIIKEKIDIVGDAALLEGKVNIPKFRVSSKRVGVHSFTSEDVAKTYGALIQEGFLWIVDLTNFDLEIMTTVSDNIFMVSISLTKSSLHRRNLTVFGLTSLRATICYGLIKLANPQVGEIVIDPLAGSGSIPIEGSAAFPNSYFLAGDFQDVPCSLTKRNLDSFNREKKLTLDILKWDSVKLPIRNASVDAIATDMPFGKRCGSKKSNKVLYPSLLKEFGRVLVPISGRAVLLTADRRSLELALHVTSRLWTTSERRNVNIGGIKAVLFLLRRSVIRFIY